MTALYWFLVVLLSSSIVFSAIDLAKEKTTPNTKSGKAVGLIITVALLCWILLVWK